MGKGQSKGKKKGQGYLKGRKGRSIEGKGRGKKEGKEKGKLENRWFKDRKEPERCWEMV